MFIGRKQQLDSLRGLQNNQKSNLVIIRGRRRIGKSRLVEEFAKGQRFIRISGLAPTEKITKQEQRDEFAKQMAQQTQMLSVTANDWLSLFMLLSEQLPKTERVVVLLDEISWMGSKDHRFLAQLKDCWDFYFSKLPKLTLILCGSVSAWIEKEIVQSSAFLGRISLNITLNQLSARECHEFWRWGGSQHISAFEQLKMLSVTGGVPYYLELLNPKASAEENLRALCFKPESPLLNEFEAIFTDIFGSRSGIYKKIIMSLLKGPKTQKEILAEIKLSKSGQTSEYLAELELAGFIARDYSWNLKTKKPSSLSRYRLKDNYLRFYLKHVELNKSAIQKGLFYEKPLNSLPGWNALLGLQFEVLVLNNSLSILRLLQISPADVENLGPYYQPTTAQRQGCQIDLLIQTKQNILYVCEIKFSKNPIGEAVAREVDEKILRLTKPKGISCLPVLIHINGVTEDLEDEQYFYRIIDFVNLLQG